MERCGGDGGKGFFLGLMTNMLEEQETKALQDATHGAGTKDGPSQPGKRKSKCTPLNLPLKSSIKGEPKGPLSIVNSVFNI